MNILTENELKEVLEMEKYCESREQYCIRKQAQGFKIFKPDKNELSLDIDSQEDYEKFLVRFSRLQLEPDFMRASFTEFKSSTPEHRHIIVTLPFEIEMEERIAWQAILGSDPIRELLSMLRLYNGDPYPTLLAMKGVD